MAEVLEILDVIAITKVPQSPDFMRGVINLRGCVVPAMDMRLKFGLSPTERTGNTGIIVVEISKTTYYSYSAILYGSFPDECKWNGYYDRTATE